MTTAFILCLFAVTIVMTLIVGMMLGSLVDKQKSKEIEIIV